MDEIQISGKQYISSRRAAATHGYTADYLGQLIRSKKIRGQKIGRAWYIEAQSLAEYLATTPNEERVAKETSLPEKEEVVAAVALEEVPVVAEKQKFVEDQRGEEIIPDEAREVEPESAPAVLLEELQEHLEISVTKEKESVLEEKIPIRVEEVTYKGLTYVSDEEAFLPELSRKTSIAATSAMSPSLASTGAATSLFPQMLAVGFVGMLVLLLTAGASVLFLSTTSITGEEVTSAISLSF